MPNSYRNLNDFINTTGESCVQEPKHHFSALKKSITKQMQIACTCFSHSCFFFVQNLWQVAENPGKNYICFCLYKLFLSDR